MSASNSFADLMAPAADNPKGFFEHAGVVAIHDRLLQALGRSWNDARALPGGWAESDAAAAAGAESEGSRILKETGTKGHSSVVHDLDVSEKTDSWFWRAAVQ